MTKMNTYYIPVESKIVSTLVVEALNETDATNQVKATIAKNKEAGNKHYDSFEILYSDIVCKEDDNMMEQLVEDFDTETTIHSSKNKEIEVVTVHIPNKTNNIIIYTGTDCPWCHKTIKYLSSKKLLFVDKNVNTHPQFKDEMISLTKQSSLPALIINGKIVLGFDKRAIEAALYE